MINKIESGKQASPAPSPLILRGCPYFGIDGDADTRLMFPIEGAVCHRAQPVDEVQLSYQQTTCLTAEHQSCEVFLRQHRAPLPPEISGWEVRGPRSRRVFLGVIIILMFTAVGILAGLWWVNDSGDLEALIPAGEPQGILAATHTATAAATKPVPAAIVTAATVTLRPPATPEPTAVPTLTPVPTETPTPSLPPTFTPMRPTNTATTTAVRPQTSMTVNVERLNVRQGPGVTYPSLGLVESGAIYDVVGRVSNGSWLQICCIDGVAGWVLAETVLVQGVLEDVPVIRDIPPPSEATP